MRKVLWILMNLKGFRWEPRFKKYLIVSAVVGSVALVGLAALFVGGAWWLMKGASGVVSQVSSSVDAREAMNDLKTQIPAVPAVAVNNCLMQAQALLSPAPWIENSIVKNFVDLKNACLIQNTNPISKEGESI